MRIAILTRLPADMRGITPIIRERGHDVVGVVATEGPSRRYGKCGFVSCRRAARRIDILVADNSKRFAPLLAALEPDLAVCGGFPVRIPADAIAVPLHGVLNGHPSPLPRYRGPNPIGWALRDREPELGFTFHFMDADSTPARSSSKPLRRWLSPSRPTTSFACSSGCGPPCSRERSRASGPVSAVPSRVRRARATRASSSPSSSSSTDASSRGGAATGSRMVGHRSTRRRPRPPDRGQRRAHPRSAQPP